MEVLILLLELFLVLEVTFLLPERDPLGGVLAVAVTAGMCPCVGECGPSSLIFPFLSLAFIFVVSVAPLASKKGSTSTGLGLDLPFDFIGVFEMILEFFEVNLEFEIDFDADREFLLLSFLDSPNADGLLACVVRDASFGNDVDENSDCVDEAVVTVALVGSTDDTDALFLLTLSRWWAISPPPAGASVL